MAWRLPAYPGVMQQRVTAAAVAAEQDDGPQDAPAGSIHDLLAGRIQPQGGPPAHQHPAAAAGRTETPGTKEALQANPAFAGIFSFGGGSG